MLHFPCKYLKTFFVKREREMERENMNESNLQPPPNDGGPQGKVMLE